ncbi:ASF1 like histone chaperone domain-containing protein [Ditylenchus destructor]|uniref:ASF1 like histone chaperone domain-containing protein n=1 Tax=Ditylenchus destructor TaxID=166010 RepID=A0AAD4N626_9BILA|nr:ASF1 like histone chaperone domain-containing protein [Ditylenchus destructor]
MSALVKIYGVQILGNPSKVNAPIKMEISFEAFESIKDEIECELTFVASDAVEERDQLLETVVIGPFESGSHKFTFEAPAPDMTKLSAEDVSDCTALLLKCKYRNQTFTKFGWLVTHVYTDEELVENPPETPILEKLERNIDGPDVRVTHFPIKWVDSAVDEKDMGTSIEQAAGDASAEQAKQDVAMES